jgi:DNA processing protein
MALIADATVIVEASEKSGTRHQGWEALRMYRTLMIMSNVSRDPDLTWPAEMIQYGAIELTRGNLEAVLEDLPTASSIANAS